MSKSTISTFKLFERFPDEEATRLYLEGLLWPNGVKCPDCKSGERITVRVDEFSFRLNEGNVERHTWERLESFVNAIAGKRITYKELTA